MEQMTGKERENKGENQQEIRRGRPRKDKSGALFMNDNSVNPMITDSWEESEVSGGDGNHDGQGTVMEGGAEDMDFQGFSVEARMAACAKLARTGRTDAVRLQAIIKYSELERQQRAELGEADLGEECLAFIRMVKASSPAEMVQEV